MALMLRKAANEALMAADLDPYHADLDRTTKEFKLYTPCGKTFATVSGVLFSSLARERASHYLTRRFPKSSGLVRFRHCYLLILEFGKVLVDRAVVGILGPEAFDVSLNERDELLKLRDENNGIIF